MAPFVASTAARAPSPPRYTSVTIISASQLRVSWASPASNGGASVTRYVINEEKRNTILMSFFVSAASKVKGNDNHLVSFTCHAYSRNRLLVSPPGREKWSIRRVRVVRSAENQLGTRGTSRSPLIWKENRPSSISLENVRSSRHRIRYTVQWSSDESFGSGSGEAKVSVPAADNSSTTKWMTYTIEGEACSAVYVQSVITSLYGNCSSVEAHARP